MARNKGGHYCFGCGQYLANEKFSGKGSRKHICKKCQKSGRKTQNKRESNFFQEWDNIFESDENFSFIAGYTEAGFPYGVTYEEWDEIEQQENETHENPAFITISNEIADKLRKTSSESSLEKSIYYSIALSLYVSNSISIQKAASIADCEVNDFIHFLQSNNIPWSFGNEDGYEEYQKSIDDLLIKIDKFIEQVDANN